MKTYIKTLAALALSALAFAACNNSKEPFATAKEDDAPRILNTNIPLWEDGQPAQLTSIERTTNFNFEIIVTPAKYTTVVWNIDDEDVFEGNEIDIPLMAGVHDVVVTATSTKGLSTSRSFTVSVRPAAADPVMSVSQDMIAPGQQLVLAGTNLEKVKKVFLESNQVEIIGAPTATELTVAIPANLPAGAYPVFFENEAGEELSAVWFDGTNYYAYCIMASPDPMTSTDAFTAKPGQGVVLEGINLDKVQSILVNGEAATITSKQAGELVFTCPELEAGDYSLTGTASSGAAVNFAGKAEAVLTVVTSPEVELWKGSFNVTWGTPFKELQFTLADQVKVGYTLRAYVNGEGQGCLATAWWRNLATGHSDDDEGRGDTIISGETVLEMVISELSLQLLADQEGFFLVGDGYTVTRITIEPPSEQTIWEGSFDVTWETPFDGLKETLLDMVSVGTIVRGYVHGEGQGCLATSWWNNIYTGESDPNRGDSIISGEMVLEYTLTQISLDLLATQQGALFVGNGYTITKVTIE